VFVQNTLIIRIFHYVYQRVRSVSNLTSLSGVVSNVNHFSKTTGSVSVHRGTGSGSVRTKLSITFRVDNKTVFYPGRPDVGDGDVVTVIGTNKGGVTSALVVRNDSTGVEYANLWPVTIKNFWGGFLVFMGLMALSSNQFFALFVAGIGAFLLFLGRKQKQEINQLSRESRKNLSQSQSQV
jgi:hypothetical protein